MAPDANEASRAPRNRAPAPGFVWVSSSPSPDVVSRLEARFPDIIKVPVEVLEDEAAGWRNRAVIVRSFPRWVPAEAIIREFRRAGVTGAIDPISLAFRCHIFRFEDPAACDLVINRPWMVNGQILGTEAWRPDFFPGAEAVSSVLMWVRLPNLPLEYWQEEVIKLIMEPAGTFISVDAATMAKNRGGYARVCMRVDLLCPFRPGTRIQGLHGPFWQQFMYEGMEGICSTCGTLHLKGPCSSPATAESEDPANCSVFGPWIAAVRQRRSAIDPQLAGRRFTKPTYVEVASGNSIVPFVSPSEGWKKPATVARRRGSGSQMVGGSSGGGDDLSGLIAGKGKAREEAVQADDGRAVFQFSVAECLNIQPRGVSAKQKSKSIVLKNQFASLGDEDEVGSSVVHKVAHSGPLKRARPADNLAPRSLPKADKGKGKHKINPANPTVDMVPVPDSQSTGKVVAVISSSGEGLGQELALLSSELPSSPANKVVIEGGQMLDSSMMLEDGTLVPGGLFDSVMVGDPGGILPSIS